MNDRDECRRPTCDRPARGTDDPNVQDGFAVRFCSTPCELKYDHIRADVRGARRDAQREAREEDRL